MEALGRELTADDLASALVEHFLIDAELLARDQIGALGR